MPVSTWSELREDGSDIMRTMLLECGDPPLSVLVVTRCLPNCFAVVAR